MTDTKHLNRIRYNEFIFKHIEQIFNDLKLNNS